MTKPGHSGLHRLVLATRYSMQGLRAAWHNEQAFRQELTLALVLLPCAFWVGRSAVEVFLLIGVLVGVLVVELLNSAVEAVVDRASPEQHELAGRAKDMGSAAVFLSVSLAGCTWLCFLSRAVGLSQF